MVAVYLLPKFSGEDRGDGGIRRVVEAQRKYLNIVDSPDSADVVAVHAGMYVNTDKPYVAHTHGLYWSDFEWPRWSIPVNRQVAENIRRADAVTAPSDWVANAIKRSFNVPVTVLPHGINTSEWPKGTNEGYILWNKARVDSVCNPAIVNELATRVSGVEFVSTFGDERPNVKIVGKQTFENSKKLTQGAAVYLSTTLETFGIGALEAMSCGVPVLGWNEGGIVDFVMHKEHGYLAQPGNIQDLVEGLQWCLDNREAVSEKCIEDVDKYHSWEGIMYYYTQLYESLARPNNKLSVVIPCYNLGRWLPAAVQSVVDQCDEVIIVDDASTDDSPAVCDSLASDKVKILHHAENQHVAAARNTGITAASGDLILCLDADDRMASGSLDILRLGLQNDNVDIAYGACQFFDTDYNPITRFGPDGVSSWPPPFEWQGLHKYPFSYCPTASMFRRRVWQRCNGFRERYKGVEDADFWTRAINLGMRPSKITEAVTLQYTVRTDSRLSTSEGGKVDWTAWYLPEPLIKVTDPVVIPAYNKPKLTVVIPCGPGHERKVLDALDSLQGQTFKDWECIVVFDNTIAELPEWVIAGHVGTANSPAKARNMGVAMARTKLVYFLDADDYFIRHDSLDILFRTWAANQGTCFVYSDWTDETNAVHQMRQIKCEDALVELPTPVNILFDKSCGVKFDTDLIGWEEWDFALQLLNTGMCGVRAPYPLFKYNTQSGTRRHLAHDNRESIVDVLDAKWKPYRDGVLTMACGSCGGGVYVAPQSQDPSQAPIPGTVAVEYTGTDVVRTYRGQMTGESYRFGDDDVHHIRLVDERDVNGFLSLDGFKLVGV